MNEHFPPLCDPRELPRRVLVLAPHPDDEVLGCGGLLAFHAERGDATTICFLTDEAARVDVRRAEARAAAEVLGVRDVRFMGEVDGALGAVTHLAHKLEELFTELGPELVYVPSPLEHHPDHAAASRAAVSALAVGPPRRVHFYGVNAPLAAGVLYDVSRFGETKRRALAAYVSQQGATQLFEKSRAADRARTANMDDPRVVAAEAYVSLASSEVLAFQRAALELKTQSRPHGAPQHAQARPPGVDRNAQTGPLGVDPNAGAREWPRTTAVVSTWNKQADLRENLLALRAQTFPFAEIVVVDNCSKDGTARMVREHFPDVRLIVMPHDRYGACETFNIGFSSALTELTAILDDDIVMPPEWLEKATARLMREPMTTAVLSTQVVEPGTPESYLRSPAVNSERYMSTFRGCASLARSAALREARYYDERLFIYGNERDLTCRLLNLGYRVLQYPGCGVFHKTPFGIKMGKRSLYYHARNAFLSMLKYAPLSDLVQMPWLVLTRVLLRGERKEAAGEVADATGTIGIGRSLRETKGATWVLVRAAGSVLWNVPYCWKHRAPCRAQDFELPLS